MLELSDFWVLTAGFLVFLMQPGFAALEAGFVQAKNVISISIKNVIDFLVVFLLFGSIGYGVMFGDSVGGIFGSNQFFFIDLQPSLNDALHDVLPETHLFFQVLFAATAVTIVSGALAERTKLITYVLFACLMSIIIYPVFGHWSWGNRIFTNQAGWLGGLGFMDFAGGTVVHSIGGWSALAGALVVGPRLNKYSTDGAVRALGKENIPYAVLGMFFLWIGWLGFNGGSVSNVNENISLVILNTNLAAACGGLTALFFDYWKQGVFHGDKIIIGIIAGLVAITASAGWVNPNGAILIGGLAGVFVVICENWIEFKLKIDDPLSASAIHGCCGAMGSLLLPLFITDIHLSSSGMSRIHLFGIQVFGVTVAFFWSFGLSYFFFKLLDRGMGLRVKEEDEMRGLDLAEYGEKASWLNFVEIAKMRNINEVLEESAVTAKAASIAEKKRADELQEEIKERKRVENLLHRKTGLLQLMQKITITANEASTVDEAVQVCLDEVCEYMGWPIGHVYIVDSMGQLIPSKIWHIENAERFDAFRKVTEVTSFDRGIGLPGRVLASGKPAWIADVTKDPNFPRAKSAKEINVKAGFAFPVLEGKEVVGVLEFFSEEAIEPDGPILDALSNLAVQIGRVTGRKRLEENLRKLSQAMEQSPASVILTNVEGNIEYVNPKFTEVTGYTKEEIMGKNPRLLKSGEKHSDEYKDLWEVITSGKEWHGEFHNKKKNGELYWEFASISSIKNEDGKITHFLAVKEDITERKRMEELIRHKSELIQLVQKITITANEVSTIDEAMQICLDNICSYAGWQVGHVYLPQSDRKLIPSTLWHFDSPQQFKAFREITEATSFDIGVGLPGRVLLSREPIWITDVTKEPWFLRTKFSKDINVKAGFAFPVLEGKKVVAVLEFFSKEAIEPDKSFMGAISILTTQLGRMIERKRAEEERQKMQLKMVASSKLATLGEMSTGVAHEINQPLTYISSLIQTLKLDIKEHSIDETKLEEKLNFASGQVGRIISIIDHLRTFGRQYDIAMEKIDIKAILKNTLLLLGERIRMRNIKLVCNTEEKLPMVLGNANQVEQIFINLFQNAIDALQNKKEKAEIRVDISISAEREAVQIKFSDNGHGMKESIREKIFEPFFTTKEVGQGTGLGLSIVHGILQEHKGEITCESQINKGTTFIIKIPLEKRESRE